MILVVRKNMLVTQTLEFDREEIFIGRGKDSDLVLSDPEVSKKHARVFWQDGKVFVEDLGSANGVYLGKGKILRAELSS